MRAEEDPRSVDEVRDVIEEQRTQRVLSPRLAAIVAALPLHPSLRVLEIGCGPGAAARAVAARLTDGHLLAVDRSPAAVAQAQISGAELIAAGRLSVRRVAVEDLVLAPGEAPFDLVFAVRVGVLDGRHPSGTEHALKRIAGVTTPEARLLVDGGDPLRELVIPRP
jgi:SAM-dependent methyltransferase